jgi:hypothetical protein
VTWRVALELMDNAMKQIRVTAEGFDWLVWPTFYCLNASATWTAARTRHDDVNEIIEIRDPFPRENFT